MIKLSDLIINEFEVPTGGGDNVHRPDTITIVKRKQMEGTPKWAIMRHASVLNRELEWEYEPSPSHRDDDFLVRCRYESVEEALEYINKWMSITN